MAESGMILSNASPEGPLYDGPSSCIRHDLDGLLEFPSEQELSTARPASGAARQPATVPILEFDIEVSVAVPDDAARSLRRRQAAGPDVTRTLLRGLREELGRVLTASVVRGRLLLGRSMAASRGALRRLGTYRTPAWHVARTFGRHAWRGVATVGRALVRIIDRQPTRPRTGGSPLSFVGGLLVGTVGMLIIGLLSGETPRLPALEPATQTTQTMQATTLVSPFASPSLLPESRLVSRQPTRLDNATSVTQGPAVASWSGFVSAGVPEPASPPAALRGSISIESQPQGGVVYLNNVAVGTTPLLLTRMQLGSRAVRIEKDGYQRWSGVVQIVAGRRAGVAAELSVASLVP